jgi:imidazolonepropionase-like amidohydrolase
MKLTIKLFLSLFLGLGLTLPVLAAGKEPPKLTLFTNVHLFDGVGEKRIENANVLVEGNLIKAVSTRAIQADGATVIDGGGRTLMPGLIDAHWHTVLSALTIQEALAEEADFIYARAIVGAEQTLLRGFTTVRDIGGPGFGIKKAIDQGLIVGPRMFVSGAMISQTAGHGDFGQVWEGPRGFGGRTPRFEQLELTRIADGVDEVLAATRYNLKKGAHQIKMMAGGGISSVYDPLHVNEYTFDEWKAAVDAAADWGTYVTAHIYNQAGIKRVLNAGVKGIEHGVLMDEEAAKLMAEKGAWLSLQPFTKDEPGSETLSPASYQKLLQVVEGVEKSMELVKKYKINMAFGTDLLFSPAANGSQANRLTRFSKYFSNIEILRMATSNNAKYFELSGPGHPYQEGALGVIKDGAYADILLVDGNPLEDVSILGDNAKNISLIMKDGKIFKNTL